jgi:hypothetical protein
LTAAPACADAHVVAGVERRQHDHQTITLMGFYDIKMSDFKNG